MIQTAKRAPAPGAVDARQLEPLGAPPKLPTLIEPLPVAPSAYGDLAGLARRIQALRAGRGLRLAEGVGSWRRGDTVPLINVYAVAEDGEEAWLCAAILPATSLARAGLARPPRAALQAAIFAAGEANAVRVGRGVLR